MEQKQKLAIANESWQKFHKETKVTFKPPKTSISFNPKVYFVEGWLGLGSSGSVVDPGHLEDFVCPIKRQFGELNDVGVNSFFEKDTRSQCRSLSVQEKLALYEIRADLMMRPSHIRKSGNSFSFFGGQGHRDNVKSSQLIAMPSHQKVSQKKDSPVHSKKRKHANSDLMWDICAQIDDKVKSLTGSQPETNTGETLVKTAADAHSDKEKRPKTASEGILGYGKGSLLPGPPDRETLVLQLKLKSDDAAGGAATRRPSLTLTTTPTVRSGFPQRRASLTNAPTNGFPQRRASLTNAPTNGFPVRRASLVKKYTPSPLSTPPAPQIVRGQMPAHRAKTGQMPAHRAKTGQMPAHRAKTNGAMPSHRKVGGMMPSHQPKHRKGGFSGMGGRVHQSPPSKLRQKPVTNPCACPSVESKSSKGDGGGNGMMDFYGIADKGPSSPPMLSIKIPATTSSAPSMMDFYS